MSPAILTRLIYITLGNILKRRWVSGTIVLASALVVIVLVGFLSMSEGFRQALSNTGSDNIAMLMSGQAQNEMNSQLTREQVELLQSAPGVQKRDGNTLLSSELSVIVGVRTRVDNSKRNVTLRGMSHYGPVLREGFTLTEGRMFTPGRNEILVGEKVAREVQGLDLGNTLRLSGSDWTVVGTFSLAGNLFESEIWADLSSVQSAYNRHNQYQSVRIALVDKNALFDLTLYSAEDVRLDLAVQSEKQYFSKQTEGMVNLVSYLAWPLAILLSIGTFTGIYNAMQISIDSRRREFVILRQIGFSRLGIFISILFESLLCSIVGAGVGISIALLLFDGFVATTMGSNFDSVSYALSVNGGIVLRAFLLSAIVGFLAVFIPAHRGVNQRLAL